MPENMPANRARLAAAREQAARERTGQDAETRTHDGSRAWPVPDAPGLWVVALGHTEYAAVRITDGREIGDVDVTLPHLYDPGWSVVARLGLVPTAMDTSVDIWAHVPVCDGKDGETHRLGRVRKDALAQWQLLLPGLAPGLAQRAADLAAERIKATRTAAREQCRADAQSLLAAFPDEGPLGAHSLIGVSRVEQLWESEAMAQVWDQVATAMDARGIGALEAILDQRGYCVMRLTGAVGGQVLPMQTVQREIRRASWVAFLEETKEFAPDRG